MEGSTPIRILPGQSSAQYFLSTRPGPEIRFVCPACFDLGLTTEGSWNERANGVVSTGAGSSFSEDTVVDIVLEPASRFQGRVAFPDSFESSGFEIVIFNLLSADADPLPFSVYSFARRLRPNVDGVLEFSFSVPTALSVAGYTLQVGCNACIVEGITSSSLFATTSNGDPLSTDERRAEVFPNGDNFDLTLSFQDVLGDKVITAPLLDLLLNEDR